MARGLKDAETCNAKEGNPFGPFWDTFGVDFDGGSEFYGPLNYDVHHQHGMVDRWMERYPPDLYPGSLLFCHLFNLGLLNI